MDPSLEFFLEDAFGSVQPSSPTIGRVVVEPDYDRSPDPQDRESLASQLAECIQRESPSARELTSVQGFEIKTLKQYSTLSKYLRSITLHKAPSERPWVAVAPPGNWI
jgi:hypothetical protein